MIYILTVHFKSEAWIPIQRKYLEQNMSEEFRVHGCLEGIDRSSHSAFDRILPAIGQHAGKLNLLAWDVLEVADPDDLLIFMDGDAFPIADPMPRLRGLLTSYPLVAVRRSENAGDPQPHPCFAVTTAGFWREIYGDWSPGYPWRGRTGVECTDVGGNLRYVLQQRGIEWFPLVRTNEVDFHPVWFAIYDGVIYHHGSGFWKGVSREVGASSPWKRLPDWLPGQRLIRHLDRRWVRKKKEELHRLNSAVLAAIREDPLFYRRFLGKAEKAG